MKLDFEVNNFLTLMKDNEVCLINVWKKFVCHNETRLRFLLIDTSNANRLLFLQNRLMSSAKDVEIKKRATVTKVIDIQ